MRTEKMPIMKSKPCNCGCKNGSYGSFKSYVKEVITKPKPERKKPKKKQSQIFYKKK